jgi:6-phosphogluconolactonase (cycloisomerase 2 family)
MAPVALGVSGVTSAAAADDAGAGGATVYTMTNGSGGNAAAVFRSGRDGALSPAGTVPTGGTGTGNGLGNQGALALSRQGRWLLVVNAGSHELSLFRVQDGPRGGGLVLADRVPSGGRTPVSVTVHRDLVYVANDGGDGARANITAFTIERRGKLAPLPDSTRPLSTAAPDVAQVQFSPDGERLVVTEKATNLLSSYVVDEDGLARGPLTHPSSGPTPFGFAFDPRRRDRLYVSEAFPGVPNGSAASAYEIDDDGRLTLLQGSVPTRQTAACWVVVTPDGRYTYTANAGSNSITGFRIGPDGRLTRLNEDGVTASGGAGSGALDLAIDRRGRFLYVLFPGADRIGAYAIGRDGSLTPAPGGPGPGTPDGANGLAAR